MSAPAAEPAATVYVVKRGDTLGQIANRHGVTTAALAKENGIRNANLIYAGQKLTVPAR
jgi:LysM repeat protein